jgi:hypothetical protein
MTQDMRTLTPMAIDTAMLAHSSARMHAWSRIDMLTETLRSHVARLNGYQHSGYDVLGRSRYADVAGVEITRDEIKRQIDMHRCTGDHYTLRYVAQIAEHQTTVDEASAMLNAIQAEFDARGGWTRYWLVVSSSGHIHRSMDCFTCNNGKRLTEFALYPALSGFTSDKAVARLGAALCSHCYPDAPTEHREQVKISKSAVAKLLETGNVEAFDAAIAKAAAQAAKMCAGSNKPGVASSTSGWQKCTHCDNTARTMSMNGTPMNKLPRHKPYTRKVSA